MLVDKISGAVSGGGVDGVSPSTVKTGGTGGSVVCGVEVGFWLSGGVEVGTLTTTSGVLVGNSGVVVGG